MNDRTKEFVWRRNEEKLKRKFVKVNMWNRLTNTKNCMLCGGKPTQKYPIYLCNDCFTLLFNPCCVEESDFVDFYHFYKALSDVNELKSLFDFLEEYSDAIYCNLKVGIVNKIKNTMCDNQSKQKLKLLTMQYSAMKNNFSQTLEHGDLDIITSYKDSIRSIKYELTLLLDELSKAESINNERV